MSKRLPPAGSGYSGRYVSDSSASKDSKATIAVGRSGSATPGRYVKTPPKGSAGVSRAK
jgi:hypothetical protein